MPIVQRPGPSFRNQSDFQVLEFPKIKFLIDHRGQRVNKHGALMDEDDFGPPIDIEPRPACNLPKPEKRQPRKLTCDEIIQIAL
jgi:hypothetical protein